MIVIQNQGGTQEVENVIFDDHRAWESHCGKKNKVKKSHQKVGKF